MRLAGLRSLLFWAVAIIIGGAVSGCDNPFNPLNQSDKIQGLTYFEFTAAQAHWDSDPEWDGLEITLNYYNEFGDVLSFHDKPHNVQIELWSEVAGATSSDPTSRGTLLASKTIEFSNSADLIRIPIEYYAGSLELPSTESITGILLVRIFPPQEYPRYELVAPLQSGVEFYTPEDVPK